MSLYSPFLNLLVQCGLATILLCGAVLARQQRFRAHGWVQSTVVVVNLAVILGFMLPSFSRLVAPHWRITLHGASAVSYTHLDVYKRQAGCRAGDPDDVRAMADPSADRQR